MQTSQCNKPHRNNNSSTIKSLFPQIFVTLINFNLLFFINGMMRKSRSRRSKGQTDERTEMPHRDLVSNPSPACAASPSLFFFHLALIIRQRNKLCKVSLSAGNLIEVSSRKSFYSCEGCSGVDRPLIISNYRFSSYTARMCSKIRHTDFCKTCIIFSFWNSSIEQIFFF